MVTTCITKLAKRVGMDPAVEADMQAGRYLGDYNERVERAGYEDRVAERLYAKCQFWLDRYNKITGNA